MNCIFNEQEYLGNTRKKRKATCKKPKVVALINMPFTIDSNILMFYDQDLENVHSPYDNALIIKVQIPNAIVSRVSMDNGSGINALFMDAAEKMGILDNINKGKTTIHTFNEASV